MIDTVAGYDLIYVKSADFCREMANADARRGARDSGRIV